MYIDFKDIADRSFIASLNTVNWELDVLLVHSCRV